MLLGRRRECASIDKLLDEVRAGQSGTLVLHGPAGIGKTALLDYAIERAKDFRVHRVVGIESEMELAFAALHQLCSPMLPRRDRLAPPQRDALATAFGLLAGPAPDRFFVGLAVLNLLSEFAEDQRLLCVVDDAQWLDGASAQALAFVARRLRAESVALLLSMRERGEQYVGLPSLEIGGLAYADARQLLESAIPVRLDDQVRDHLLSETEGNPLALLELPRGLSLEKLAGGFGLPQATSLSSRLEETFRRRLEPLPDETQTLLLLMAADSAGQQAVLLRACLELGISPDASSLAQTAGLLQPGDRPRFRHPLVRSAVYKAASVDARRRVHQTLANATDPRLDSDRWAWHRAQATSGSHEEIADDLERSAARAQTRGGLAAAAAFLARAAELTPPGSTRAGRALAAAEAMNFAGSPLAAIDLIAMAELEPLDERQRAQAERLRAQVAFTLHRGQDAVQLLVNSARRLEALDPKQAQENYLEVFVAAVYGGLLDQSSMREVAETALRVTQSEERDLAALLLRALAVRHLHGIEAAIPHMQEALNVALSDEDGTRADFRWFFLLGIVASTLWDDHAWHDVCVRQIRLEREAGALTVLPGAMQMMATHHMFVGDFNQAEAILDEADAISRAAGHIPLPNTSLHLAAWRGLEGRLRDMLETTVRDAAARGEGLVVVNGDIASATLYNAVGRYEEAFAAAKRAWQGRALAPFSLIELVEAGARTGRRDEATIALQNLTKMTAPFATGWALGFQARSRALLEEGAAAEASYREAIDHLAGTRIVIQLARAHLIYGEWLRRENRRIDAREQLRAAHDMFERMGAAAFAARAAREILATGEHARRRSAGATQRLTAQENEIARLALQGLSNPEIAAQLFISARTVEYHLHKVFGKLDISSRHQLAGALAELDASL